MRQAGAAAAWVKDSSPFVQHGTNLETRLADLDGLLTPNDLFFVRNHAPTPVIDPAAYRLAVGGPGAETRIELSLDELRALPSHTLISYLECAGNWRGFFQRITGRTASGSQWGTGAVGCAEWSGPRLADVLALAGVGDDAVEVNVIGLDEAEWARPMPLAKALDPDTILALTMNGELAAAGPRLPRAGDRAWLGGVVQREVGGEDRGGHREGVGEGQHDLVCAGGRGVARRPLRAGRRRPDHDRRGEERSRAAVPGRPLAGTEDAEGVRLLAGWGGGGGGVERERRTVGAGAPDRDAGGAAPRVGCASSSSGRRRRAAM